MFFICVDMDTDQTNKTKDQAISAKSDGIHKIGGGTIVPHG